MTSTLSMRVIQWALILQVYIYQAGAQLKVEDVSEGPCLSISEVATHLYKGDLTTAMEYGTYYFPMGSKAMYRAYAEGLLGRPAENQEELDKMQITLQCGLLFSTIQYSGFFHMKNIPRFGQTCGPPPANISAPPPVPGAMDLTQCVCIGLPASRPDGSMALVASKPFTHSYDFVPWANADGSVFLVYRCPANGLKDYKVVSRTKTLKEEDIAAITAKIVSLGYKEENVAFLKYDDKNYLC